MKPAPTFDALVPGFAYFAAWYLLGALAFWLIGTERAAARSRRSTRK